MRLMLDDIDCELSHISDMMDQPRPSNTTLRVSASMVLIALCALRLSEAMTPYNQGRTQNTV